MAARPKRASGTKYKIELIVNPIEPKEKITFLFNRSNDSLSSYNIDNEPISASNKSLLRNLAENLIRFDIDYIEKIGSEDIFKEIYTRLYNDLKGSRGNLPRPEDIFKVSGSADGKVAGHSLSNTQLPGSAEAIQEIIDAEAIQAISEGRQPSIEPGDESQIPMPSPMDMDHMEKAIIDEAAIKAISEGRLLPIEPGDISQIPMPSDSDSDMDLMDGGYKKIKRKIKKTKKNKKVKKTRAKKMSKRSRKCKKKSKKR